MLANRRNATGIITLQAESSDSFTDLLSIPRERNAVSWEISDDSFVPNS